MKQSVPLTLLFGIVALPCAAASLPGRYADLIRHDKFAEAEAAAAAARISADAKHEPEALCAAAEFQVRVSSFDIYLPAPVKLADVERALQCREGLRDSADKSAHIAMLKASSATLVFSVGDRKRAAAIATEAGAQIKGYRRQLDAVDYAQATLSLGNVANSNGDFNGALAWTEESVSAVRGADESDRMMRTRVLVTQCHRLGRLGRFAEAEMVGKASVDLSAQMFGVPSLYHANALATLGEVQYFGHHLADAALSLEQAIDDARRLGGRVGGTLATALMAFANVQNDMGQYDRARTALTEAVAVLRRDDSPNQEGNLAAALSNLGMAEAASGHCEAALAPVREGLQLARKRYGDDSPELTGQLSVLGNCELEMGQNEQARIDYGQALEISKKALGEDNPLIAQAYQEMALVDLADHDYVAATEHLTHALSRLPKEPDTLGDQRIVIERNLARSLHAQHDDAAAFEHAVAGEIVRQRLLQHFAAALDESEALGATETEHDNLDEILALAAARRDPKWIERAWQLQIGSRSLITHLVAARLKAARASTDPDMRMLWVKWKTANTAYADALSSAEGGKGGTNLSSARDVLERAEQALAARTHASDATAPVGLGALRGGMPKDAALIGFVRARSDAWGNDYATQHPQHYYAFRLNVAAPIALIDLGDAREIDAAVRDWTAALRDPARSIADVDALGADVALRVWQPLGLADNLRSVFIVPEGELHRVAWLALPLRDGVLAEHGPVPQLLDSERDVLASTTQRAPTTHVLLVGAVPVDPALSTTACSGTLRDLPGAKRELDALRTLWRQTEGADAGYLVGNAANKSAVRAALPQGGMIHFATHAFSNDSDCVHSLLAARDLRISNANTPRNAPPLSGLLLASDAKAVAGDRDGVLTAPEIAAFNLDGVDTVTLAACDTGSGAVHPDEGVFGLARAFRLAGARNVVLSLWSVDDEATADFMQRMYRARWVEHAGAADALAGAARATLAARRAAGKSIHPYYWAAFVTNGAGR